MMKVKNRANSKEKTSIKKKKNKLSTECCTSAQEITSSVDESVRRYRRRSMGASNSNRHFKRMKNAVDDYVAKVLQKGVNGLLEDFTQIRLLKPPEKNEISHWIKHPEQNRYNNIFCLDQTRVTLKEHPEGNDYIHANVVGGPVFPDRFVCAQGPKPNTCYDFWLMIFEQKIMSILQLCRFVEDDNEKCAVYYPRQRGEVTQFGDIRIVCANVVQLATPGKVYQRVFNVFKDDIGKDVFHLSFEDWPDHGVPPVDNTLLLVLQKVRMSTNYPILVHCSAGIGRTGTIVAIENILENLMLGQMVEPYEIIVKLRLQRAQSVQRESQFLFVNRMVLEYFLQTKQLQRTPEIDAFIDDYEKAVAIRK